MMTSNRHLAPLLALLLGTSQADAHRYRTHHHHHHRRRLSKPAFEMATVEAFRPFHASPTGNGLFTSSAGPLVDVFQEVMADVKRVARELSDPTPAARAPAHEVVETEDAAILTADLPGCKKEDVDAQISEDGGTKTLTIRAVRKKAVPPSKSKSSPGTDSDTDVDPDTSELDKRPASPYSETSTTAAAAGGTPVEAKETAPASSSPSSSPASPSYMEENFHLSFTVGDGIEVSGIRGNLEDGVLTLVLPKLAPEPPAEPIEIPIAAESRGRGLEGEGRAAASIGRGGEAEEPNSGAEADTHISLS
eukprot:g16474.t1